MKSLLMTSLMIGSMGRQFGNMLGGMFAGSAQFTLDLGEFINENPYLDLYRLTWLILAW